MNAQHMSCRDNMIYDFDIMGQFVSHKTDFARQERHPAYKKKHIHDHIKTKLVNKLCHTLGNERPTYELS